AVGEAEEAGGEQSEADQGRGDDAEDGAHHVEDPEAGEHRQPDADVPGRALRGGQEEAAGHRVLLGDHDPGDEVAEDAPPGEAAEDDGEPDERRVEPGRRRQPAGHAAELALVPGPQELERRGPPAGKPGRRRRRGRRSVGPVPAGGRLFGSPGPEVGGGPAGPAASAGGPAGGGTSAGAGWSGGSSDSMTR